MLCRGGGVDELECDGWAGGHVGTIRFAPVSPLLIGGLPVPLWPDPDAAVNIDEVEAMFLANDLWPEAFGPPT